LAEEKARIVIAGLRGEDSVTELCRKEGINQNLYYRWSKDCLEAGKKRLAGDTAREATSHEVKGLRAESHQLKEMLAELMIENRVLKKSVLGDGESDPSRPGDHSFAWPTPVAPFAEALQLGGYSAWWF
jgi:transposase